MNATHVNNNGNTLLKTLQFCYKMSKYKKMKVDLWSAHKLKSKNNIEVRGFSKDSQGKKINAGHH